MVARVRTRTSPATARIATSASPWRRTRPTACPRRAARGRAPGEDAGGQHRLVGELVHRALGDALAAAQEHAADLEQRDVGAAEALVARDRGDQVRQQRRPHHRLIDAHRVAQRDRLRAAIASPARPARRCARRTGTPKVIASARPAAASAARARSARSLGRRAGAARSAGSVDGTLLVADDAQDLLDEVDLAREVGARRRRRHVERPSPSADDVAAEALERVARSRRPRAATPVSDAHARQPQRHRRRHARGRG